jgi:fused signal recognition particle receptor
LTSIRDSLTRTRRTVFGQIAGLFGAGDITDETWEDLEALLIQADVGVDTTLNLVEQLRVRVQTEGIIRADVLQQTLRDALRALLQDPPPLQVDAKRLLTVVLIVGVNGSGKTTSIGKLARYYRESGRRVMLVAGDTFRAAAIDQLQVWGERAGVPVVAGQPKGDPGAVLYDAIQSSRARNIDLLIVDTAGRLHTQYNLMAELKKIHGVAQKNVHAAPHETLLVLDASTGQNALSQAKHFQEAVNVTGVILAKLDGSAKGGMVFAIRDSLGLPVRFVGTGEKITDLAEFDPDQFIEGLMDKPGR